MNNYVISKDKLVAILFININEDCGLRVVTETQIEEFKIALITCALNNGWDLKVEDSQIWPYCDKLKLVNHGEDIYVLKNGVSITYLYEYVGILPIDLYYLFYTKNLINHISFPFDGFFIKDMINGIH